MKSYGNDWGNLRDPRELRRGIPLMPYAFASSSHCTSVGMDSTALACAINWSCECSGNASGRYLTISVGAVGVGWSWWDSSM